VSLVASVHRPALLFIRTLTLPRCHVILFNLRKAASSGSSINLVEIFANYEKEETFVDDAYTFRELLVKPASPNPHSYYLHCPTA
jgi:hypothetical protein